MTSRAKRKAIFGTAGFALFGIVFAFTVKDFSYSLPALILYAGLVTNAYFSIRCFSSITPENHGVTNVIDIGLAASYFALASAFNSILNFLTIGMFLFELAAMKYVVLLEISAPEYRSIVRKKILIDVLGAISCSLALALALAGYSFFSIWSLTLLLTAAHIYLILLRPFYKLN